VLQVLFNVLMPPLLILAATAAVSRRTDLAPGALSAATFWLFTPCLVLDALVTGTVDLVELAAILAVPVAVALVTWALGEVLLRVVRVDPGARDALLLGGILTNAGNLGLPIVTFRWGEVGALVGAVVLAGTSIVSATIGVWIAGRGHGARNPLGRLLRVPLVWALVLGLGLRLSDVALPVVVGRSVELLGQAAIPCMLVVLGLQLMSLRRGPSADLPLAGLAVTAGLKLLVVPILAWGLAIALGLPDTTIAVLVVQQAMPTAVFSVVLATEYGRPAHVAAFVVAVTTGLGFLTTAGWLVQFGPP